MTAYVGAACSNGVIDFGAQPVLHVWNGAAADGLFDPAVIDTDPPVVTITEPLPGVATLHYPAPGVSMLPDEPLIFEVTDALSDIVAIVPMVILDPFAAPEVVCRGMIDGEFAFEALYSHRSTRTVIPGGYRFMLLRRGGWEVNPRFYILAVDSAGNVTIAP